MHSMLSLLLSCSSQTSQQAPVEHSAVKETELRRREGVQINTELLDAQRMLHVATEGRRIERFHARGSALCESLYPSVCDSSHIVVIGTVSPAIGWHLGMWIWGCDDTSVFRRGLGFRARVRGSGSGLGFWVEG